MKVALFVPCYVDQLFPDVGMATVELLERLGVDVTFPTEQACCGQPLYNAGDWEAARPLAEKHLAVFAEHETVVCPSGSCTAMVRHHYSPLLGVSTEPGAKTRELCEFIVDDLGIDRIPGRFPYRVGLHASCHGARTLRNAPSSERRGTPDRDCAAILLRGLEGLELVDLARPDECCGFGGVFAVEEASISVAMGRDRLADHARAGAQVLTSADMSCLAHLGGLAARGTDGPRIMHVAEILAGREPSR